MTIGTLVGVVFDGFGAGVAGVSTGVADGVGAGLDGAALGAG
ncbi:hypothetical protein [Actinoplanes sp. NPDC026670]